MRALCGAIITAGALIGLGLAALGAGQRYAGVVLERGSDGKVIPLHLGDMDRPLIFSIVFLTCAALVGLGISLLGLAYHHHRRHHEHLRDQERLAGQQRTTV